MAPLQIFASPGGAAAARLFPVGAIMKAFTALGSKNDPMLYDVENKETKNRLLLMRVKAKPPTFQNSEKQPEQERRETIDHLYRFHRGIV